MFEDTASLDVEGRYKMCEKSICAQRVSVVGVWAESGAFVGLFERLCN